MYKIRRASEDDLRELARLWADFMDYNANFNISFKTRKNARQIFSEEMLDKRGDRSSHLTVAESDGELIGFCFCYISRKPKYFRLEKFGFIGDLYVIAERRGRGIGQALVNDAMDFFSRRKIKQVELLVATKNKAAIEFWETLGFSHLLTWMYKRK